MRPESQRMHEIAMSTLEEVVLYDASTAKWQSKNFDLKEFADDIHAHKRIQKLFDRMTKTFTNRLKPLQKTFCLYYVVQQALHKGEPIRTSYCTATPDVKSCASMPNHRKHPEKFAEVMTHMGVPRELWDCDEPIVNLRWMGITDYITALQREGKVLPPGVDPNDLYDVYTVTIRPTKKEITDV
jgi:hypothetical protein